MSVENKIVDVAVIGGGIAGSVAACQLAKAGVRTVLFERELEAHAKVCGEFISREGAELIESCGVHLEKLGAVKIDRFRVHGPFRSLEGRLREPALGFSRTRLDQELLLAAERAGAEVHRGTLVQGATHVDAKEASEIVLSLKDARGSKQCLARRVVVASGKFDVRPLQKREGRDSGFVGFKQHLQLRPSVALEMKSTCDLFVFKYGYGGLSPIEDGKFNFCFVIEKKALKRIGTDWDSLTYHIAKNNWAASHCLEGAIPLLRTPATVASVPYGFVRGARPEPGFFFVGDQMAVIPSLTGDGMSIAAMTGVEAARAILSHPVEKHPRSEEKSNLSPARVSAISYQRAMRSRLKKQVGLGYRLHLLFKNPRLLDLATAAIRPFPGSLDFLVERTRCAKPKSLRAKAAGLLKLGRRALTPV
jgi:flavin-dependent dehydrogenase